MKILLLFWVCVLWLMLLSNNSDISQLQKQVKKLDSELLRTKIELRDLRDERKYQ